MDNQAKSMCWTKSLISKWRQSMLFLIDIPRLFVNCNGFPCLAVSPFLAVPLTHWLMNLACVTLHDSCHSPTWHIRLHEGGGKRSARSIDVNYAGVKRGGTHRPVSPPKESIKVKRLVFFLLVFFFQRINNVTTVTDNDSASPDIIWLWTSHISITATHLAINSVLQLTSAVVSVSWSSL